MKVSAVDGNNRAIQENAMKNRRNNLQQNNKYKRGSETIEEKNTSSSSLNEEDVIKAIEEANKSLALTQTSFEFSIHEKTKEIMVKVLNKKTGEVIREIPPEKTLDMVAKMWELAGIIIDEKV